MVIGEAEMTKIMAGIVLYNPEIDRLLLEIQSVLPQVDFICMCDNHSDNIGIVEEKISDKPNIALIKNPENLGIGTATNQLCRYAEEHGYDWILLLDHDTVCPDNLIQEYQKYIHVDYVGMICPNVIDKDTVRKQWYSPADGQETEFVEVCIQSATLLKIEAWKICDGYNEWMFIDFVDFDFCKKLILNDYRILKCKSVVIDHQLGKRVPTKSAPFFQFVYNKTHIGFFKYFTYKNVFSKARVYYCTRNNIAYMKMYADYINKRKERKLFWKRIIKRVLRSKKRFMIISQTIKGIRDGSKYHPQLYIPNNKKQ